MSQTLIEKILSAHANRSVKAGDTADISIDCRAARDFGGPSVITHLTDHGLGIDDPSKTCFTLDCNPTGSDQKYAAHQRVCRQFARQHGISVYDIDRGIGTHLAIDEGLVGPGNTFISTDSHANILGAIGAFGQGMGDVDIAHAFATGRVWFKVPPSMKICLEGHMSTQCTPKDLTLALLRKFGPDGLLGYAVALEGAAVENLSLSARITVASMATEMGAVILLIPPSHEIIQYCREKGADFTSKTADADAFYERIETLDLSGLEPLIARPGHPDAVTTVRDVEGTAVDSVFIGSCTNGRYEDLAEAAGILKGRRKADHVVLKIVPSTDAVWRRCLDEGLFDIFKQAGALIGNAGCAGCASGQIGQNGPGEVTVSTGNRNFSGKQGKGEVYLAGPATAAASAIAGCIVSADRIDHVRTVTPVQSVSSVAKKKTPFESTGQKPVKLRGRVRVIDQDNIDTDRIYHNRYLTITDRRAMGRFTFNNLSGWEDFASKTFRGDMIVTGKNFGCGSSRQQAVDCFKSLGIQLIIAESFGAIYERNAINNALPILTADFSQAPIHDGDEIEANLKTGVIRLKDGRIIQGAPFSEVQMRIYQRGGLLSWE